MRVLDSNILIYYLQDSDQPVTNQLDTWQNEHEKLVISTVTQAEILSLPTLTNREIEQIQRFLSTLIIANVDPSTARIAALFRRNFHTKLPDAIIAATAYLHDCPLVTRNIKDFSKIKTITIEKL